ncbi:MAG: GNAT family N-acetyltransferase [Jatrophihabitantaceae bacterium]
MGRYRGVELNDVVLSSERLTLRSWRSTDAPAVHEAMQDPAMHQFLALPDPYEHCDAVEFVTEFAAAGRRDATGLACALVNTATGELVGSADLRFPAARRTAAEIGYVVYASARGHGYSAEASRVLAQWAFAHGIGRVAIHCAVGNLASAKTALNAGFGFEGVLRGDVCTPAGPADGAVFARLDGDRGEPVEPVAPQLPPTGLTDRVVTVRPLSLGDEHGLLEQEEDPVTRQWELTDTPRDADEHARLAPAARLHWLVGPVLRCAIVDTRTGSYAGMINIRLQGPPNVGGIGYAVHPTFRARGYTARALRLLARWAFDVAGFARLELGAKVANVASVKAALRAGFEADGVRQARLRNPDGTFSDEVRFALVNPRHRSDG